MCSRAPEELILHRTAAGHWLINQVPSAHKLFCDDLFGSPKMLCCRPGCMPNFPSTFQTKASLALLPMMKMRANMDIRRLFLVP